MLSARSIFFRHIAKLCQSCLNEKIAPTGGGLDAIKVHDTVDQQK